MPKQHALEIPIRPITLAELQNYDLISAPPAGFPRLTEQQYKFMLRRAEYAHETLGASFRHAGYGKSVTKRGRSQIPQAVQLYLTALQRGHHAELAQERFDAVEVRRRVLSGLVQEFGTTVGKDRALVGKVLLDSLPVAEEDNLDLATLTDRDLSDRVKLAIRELGDLELRLVTVLPPQRIEHQDETQTEPVDVTLEPDSPEASQEAVQSILNLGAVRVWTDTTDGDTGTGDERTDETDDEPDRGDD